MRCSPLLFDDQFLLEWTSRLTGVELSKIQASVQDVWGWKIAHLNREMFRRPTVDTAIATFQLADAVELITSRGVPLNKILAKLRRDRDVWASWAELRAAAMVTRASGAEIAMDVGRASGKQPDFQVYFPDGRHASIEFKAIGLSDAETNFSRRMSPALDDLLPPRGYLNFHADMDGVPPNVDWAKRAECNAAATRSSNTSLFYDFGLSGVSIVGHRGEDNYARRLRLRLINECTAQMARNEGGWAAFYWTNGAPLGTIVDCIGTDLVDANLSGIILLGDAIAFPDPVLHSFFTAWSSDSTLDRSEPISVASEVNSAYAIDVIGRFERSSGVRATLLCANDGNTRRVLLRRDGSRRILPFNFLVDEDPPVVQKDLSRHTSGIEFREFDGRESCLEITQSILSTKLSDQDT